MEVLSHQVKEMQEEVSRLQIIREDNEEIDRVFAETLQRQQPEPRTARKEGQLETMVKQVAEGGCQDGEGWKLVTSGKWKKGSCSTCRPATALGIVPWALVRTNKTLQGMHQSQLSPNLVSAQREKGK